MIIVIAYTENSRVVTCSYNVTTVADAIRAFVYEQGYHTGIKQLAVIENGQAHYYTWLEALSLRKEH